MKRYKLTKSPNPETHAFGEVIFIKDEMVMNLMSDLAINVMHLII